MHSSKPSDLRDLIFKQIFVKLYFFFLSNNVLILTQANRIQKKDINTLLTWLHTCRGSELPWCCNRSLPGHVTGMRRAAEGPRRSDEWRWPWIPLRLIRNSDHNCMRNRCIFDCIFLDIFILFSFKTVFCKLLIYIFSSLLKRCQRIGIFVYMSPWQRQTHSGLNTFMNCY